MNNNTHHKASGCPLQQEAMMINKGKRIRSKSSSKKKEEALKVVYISTPMKVTTSATKFRQTVQELTGRKSDVVRIMETSGGNDSWTVLDDNNDKDHHHQSHIHNTAHAHQIISTAAAAATTTTSDDDDGARVLLPFVLDHDGSSPSSSSEELYGGGGGGGGDGANVFLKGQDNNNFGIFDQSTNLFYDHLFQHFDILNSY